jgi:ABC-type nickel/cobalt efflux system permease component RcnA
MKKLLNNDALTLALISIISFLLFSKFDILEKVVEFSKRYEHYEIDEIISTSLVLVFALLWITIKNNKKVLRLNTELEKKSKKLEDAIAEIKQLNGILPLCSYCKRIRDDSGSWEQVDTYLQKHSEADISHSLCPDCLKEHYPQISKEMNKKH